MPWPWSKRKPKEEPPKEPDEELGSISGPSVESSSSGAPSMSRQSPSGVSASSSAPSAARRSPAGQPATPPLPTDEELRPAVEEKMREELGRSPTEAEVSIVMLELRRKMSED